MAKRIYAVENDEGTIILVRAAVPSQALAYVARQNYTVSIASQEYLVRLLQMGEKVHDYDEAPTETELDVVD